MKTKLVVMIILIILICVLVYYVNYQQRDTVLLSSRQIYKHKAEENLKTVRIMTYNIHHGVGNDGILDLNRIISIIKDSNTQIIGLNEVDYKMVRSGFVDQINVLAKELNMNYVFGPTLKTVIGSYGNAILTIFPVLAVKHHPLPVNFAKEPRGVLEADLLLPDKQKIKILTTHLSLDESERLKQLEWLNNYLKALKTPFILMGDFNKETAYFNNLPYLLTTEKTYPSSKPELGIDMFFSNCGVTENSYTIKSDGSDHLPLIIELPIKYNKV